MNHAISGEVLAKEERLQQSEIFLTPCSNMPNDKFFTAHQNAHDLWRAMEVPEAQQIYCLCHSVSILAIFPVFCPDLFNYQEIGPEMVLIYTQKSKFH